MAYTEIVNLRLSEDTHLKLSEEAALHGLNLSTFIRQRLSQQVNLEAELKKLRHAWLPSNQAPSQATSQALLMEILLLLRQSASPQTLRAVHAELERLQINIWPEV